MNTDTREVATLRSILAEGKRARPYSTNITIRSFKYLIDEPKKLGGEDKAPTPMEHILGALNGCFVVTIEMIAREQCYKLTNISIQSEGLIDPRGLFGTAKVSPHFQRVNINIEVFADESFKSFDPIKKETIKRCPVYNLIKDSGAIIQVSWRLNEKVIKSDTI